MLELLDNIPGNGSCNNFKVRTTEICIGLSLRTGEGFNSGALTFVSGSSSVQFFQSLARVVEMLGDVLEALSP